MRTPGIILLMGFLCSPIFAQETTLTDDQVKSAIEYGAKHKSDQHGLRLEDNSVMHWSPLYRNQEKGFSIVAFTPTTLIRQKSADAAREYRVLTINDVTDDMRRPILYLVVYARSGKQGWRQFGQSVQHIVIRSEDRTGVIQPTKIESFEEGAQNALSASKEYVRKTATFPLEEVQKLRMASADAEFLITVIGEDGEKNFKVKQKHFQKLP